jgi:hypothetical protein
MGDRLKDATMDTDATVDRSKDHWRGYPQVDCVGAYVWIWERLAHTAAGTRVVARNVERGPARTDA